MEVASFPEFKLDPKQPLQQQIHHQLVNWIATGRLLPGLRLPSTRKLSELLGVSRNTVTAVIDQLKAEGFVHAQTGRGSFIAADLPSTTFEKPEKIASQAEQLPPLADVGKQLANLNVQQHTKVLPFTPGVPDLDQFPMSIWQKIQRRHEDRKLLMGYHAAQGYLPLREALSTYLRVSRGVRCTPEQILITQGAQQAIALCSQLLLNEGDAVLHENPGYRGASAAFIMRQPQLLNVPLKEQVLDVDWLVANTEQTGQAKLLYTSPTHQYPMGGLLGASQRLKLLAWAKANQVWIIEDDYDSEFHFNKVSVAAMQGFTENNNVLYMGSFSKTLFPSLRLGYLVLPEKLVPAFVTAKSYSSGETPMLAQAVIADFINEGHFVRHLRRMRTTYQQKWQHFETTLLQGLGERVRIIAESAGMHLAVEIPHIDDQQLRADLAKNGFGSSALSAYYAGTAEKTGLVLGFANSSKSEREALVEFLKRWLKNDG